MNVSGRDNKRAYFLLFSVCKFIPYHTYFSQNIFEKYENSDILIWFKYSVFPFVNQSEFDS